MGLDLEVGADEGAEAVGVGLCESAEIEVDANVAVDCLYSVHVRCRSVSVDLFVVRVSVLMAVVSTLGRAGTAVEQWREKRNMRTDERVSRWRMYAEMDMCVGE